MCTAALVPVPEVAFISKLDWYADSGGPGVSGGEDDAAARSGNQREARRVRVPARGPRAVSSSELFISVFPFAFLFLAFFFLFI